MTSARTIHGNFTLRILVHWALWSFIPFLFLCALSFGWGMKFLSKLIKITFSIWITFYEFVHKITTEKYSLCSGISAAQRIYIYIFFGNRIPPFRCLVYLKCGKYLFATPEIRDANFPQTQLNGGACHFLIARKTRRSCAPKLTWKFCALLEIIQL